MRHLLLIPGLFIALGMAAQETFPVNGTLEKESVVYILENATIYPAVGDTVVGDLAFSQGRILALGEVGDLPHAVRVDARDYHIYPSFIDLWSEVGTPDTPRKRRERGPQELSSKKGAFGWNEAIRPEVRTAEHYTTENKSSWMEAMRKAGFGSALTHIQDGIIRGTGAFVALDDRDNYSVLRSDAAAFASFRKGSSTQDYPSSLMGSIALLRQTFYDARWYAQYERRREANLSLEALNEIDSLPWFFECSDKLDILRADKLGAEFGKQFIFKESGDAYHRINEVKATGGALVLSLDYPEALDVSDPHLARLVSISELKHWELAPINSVAAYLAGIEFAFTADGLKEPSKVIDNIKKSIALGLPEAEAIRALTETPAKLAGVAELVGKLQVGMLANFIITDGELFDEGTQIFENWVLGKKHILIDRSIPDLSGQYALTWDGHEHLLKVNGKPGKHKAKFEIIRPKGDTLDTTYLNAKLQQEGDMITLRFGPLDSLFSGIYMFSGSAFSDSRIWKGSGEGSDGRLFTWGAVRESDHDPKEKKTKTARADSLSGIIFPFIAYGRATMPEQETLLITNATVWTNTDQGKIEGGQVLIHNGKIIALGKSIDIAAAFEKKVPEYRTYDAQGKHLTPGIIDEHSHIAISRGVNEGTQASSAEVSIATVVNSEDVNIYRQLSGGVTAAQLLHGSANPIGGQSAIIKLRWGAAPEEMKISDADPFIKFALGENVKQSNWGDYSTTRFPQSRMGVEQVYYDLFIRAKEYEAEWQAFNDLAGRKRRRKDPPLPPAPRRDLELETILQIVNSERFISCHSYRQDEINMLMHVADSMGFRVNTFTHILEGYKVADKMAKHGAGGSSFSDWWAFKYEVKDAIPYNGAVLWSQGVVTAFNSDDAEMARRLNQEAAKAFKYGGVPEEEALKFVTLNPAKLLHLDHRMGAIAPGMDADLVLWTDHPLSIYAKAQTTFVDGRRMFDRDEDQLLRDGIRAERARIVRKMLDNGGSKGPKPSEKVPQHYHCDTITEENR